MGNVIKTMCAIWFGIAVAGFVNTVSVRKDEHLDCVLNLAWSGVGAAITMLFVLEYVIFSKKEDS